VHGASSHPLMAHPTASTVNFPIGRPGPLVDDWDGFTATVLLEKTPTSVRIGTARWMKRSFDEWWGEARLSIPLPSEIPTERGAQRRVVDLPASPAPCTDDSWSVVSSPPPTSRSGHVAVWTGTEMLIWGGWTETLDHPTDRGGRYSPST